MSIFIIILAFICAGAIFSQKIETQFIFLVLGFIAFIVGMFLFPEIFSSF